MPTAPSHLHVGIAEQGKVCALRGDHVQALMHYREAMRLVVQSQAPEVVFRHYLECSLESLEHMGAYDELLAYCTRATKHYEQHPPQHSVAELDLATIHQRCGVVLFKQGKRSEAMRALSQACETAKGAGARLPLADTLLRWLLAELTVSGERLAAEQARHRYFSVRTDTVRPARAVSIASLEAPRAPVCIERDG